MKKLEYKFISPYLPFELRFQHQETKKEDVMTMVHVDNEIMLKNQNWYVGLETRNWFPILRPLSDLTDPIEELGGCMEVETLQCRELYQQMVKIGEIQISFIPYQIMTYLFENHYDVFELIPEGLAIDINTLES